jgi:hypothetical protein
LYGKRFLAGEAGTCVRKRIPGVIRSHSSKEVRRLIRRVGLRRRHDLDTPALPKKKNRRKFGGQFVMLVFDWVVELRGIEPLTS